ncbi:MAG: hypothetical protein AAGD38_14830 [Acidobacteriota bacterium]
MREKDRELRRRQRRRKARLKKRRLEEIANGKSNKQASGKKS